VSFCSFQPYTQSLVNSTRRLKRIQRWLRAAAASLVLGMAIATPAFAEQPITYTVRAGDTLMAIAQQFSVPTSTIVDDNGLDDPDQLTIGQTLKITIPSTTNAEEAVSDLSGAHYPSFEIGADGEIHRSLSPFPPAPPPPTILDAPYHSQFDGTIWAESNCGPTALSMALGALGVNADQIKLRRFANDQMGMADPNNGTTWEALNYAAQAGGAKTAGLYQGQSYHAWTIDDLKNHLDQGHPVLLLVRYWDLPDHASSSFSGDHYITALGFDQNGNLVYDDPAFYANGADRTISPSALQRAWANTSVGLSRTAMAVMTK